MSDFTIKALTPETFGDFAALVERNGGMFAGCWCTKFHPDCAEKDESREARRALKQRLVADGIAHAALVYDGDRAVAWAEYGSPEELPGIQHRKEYLATAERLPDYRVTCILVERGFRGQSLAATAPARSRQADRAGRRRPGRGLPARHRRGPQEELVVPLQRHPHDVRARRLHLRPAQGTGQLRDGARGVPEHACLKLPMRGRVQVRRYARVHVVASDRSVSARHRRESQTRHRIRDRISTCVDGCVPRGASPSAT